LAESTVSLWRKQLRESATEAMNAEEFVEVPLPSVPAVGVSGGISSSFT
jgi:hypothetical protein